MEMNDIEIFSKKIKSKFLLNYDLKKSNWFNIGGLTKVFFKPDDLNELILFLKKFGTNHKIFVLGAGSNILFTDKNYNGFVIKLGKTLIIYLFYPTI